MARPRSLGLSPTQSLIVMCACLLVAFGAGRFYQNLFGSEVHVALEPATKYAPGNLVARLPPLPPPVQLAAGVDMLGGLGFPSNASQEHLRVGRRTLEMLSFSHAYGRLDESRRAVVGRAVDTWRDCLNFEDEETAQRAKEVCGPMLSKSTVGYGNFTARAYSLLEPALGKPQLVEAAKHVLGAETYLEWGGGGSTENFAPLALRSYTIEHVPDWCQCMKSRPLNTCISQKMAQGAPELAGGLAAGGRVHCVDTKMPLRVFGKPMRDSNINQLKLGLLAYVNEIETLGEATFDVVFVDGRMRVACALKALAFLHERSVLMIHDWSDGRPYGDHPLLLHHFDVVSLIAYDDDAELCPQRSTDGAKSFRGDTFPASPRPSRAGQDFCRLAILRPKPGHAGSSEPFELYLSSLDRETKPRGWMIAWA